MNRKSTIQPLKSGLQYGLNIKKKIKVEQSFQNHEEEEELNSNSQLGSSSTKFHSNSQNKASKIQQEAIDHDASIFDYDASYDELKRNQLVQKKLRDGEDGTGVKKARYMANLIKSANDRKLYLERAHERKLQKEREEEGFVETEQFVTEAYLEKQKEIQRLEEEQMKLEGIHFYISITLSMNSPRNGSK